MWIFLRTSLQFLSVNTNEKSLRNHPYTQHIKERLTFINSKNSQKPLKWTERVIQELKGEDESWGRDYVQLDRSKSKANLRGVDWFYGKWKKWNAILWGSDSDMEIVLGWFVVDEDLSHLLGAKKLFNFSDPYL